MSIAVGYDLHLVLYRYCCKGRYSVNIHLNVRESRGNLILTAEWSPCDQL